MFLTVFGASDDLIEVEGDIREEFNALSDDRANYLAFSDGTLLSIDYTRAGIWRIAPIALGTAEVTITQAVDDGDDDKYSDVASISGDIKWVARAGEYARA